MSRAIKTRGAHCALSGATNKSGQGQVPSTRTRTPLGCQRQKIEGKTSISSRWCPKLSRKTPGSLVPPEKSPRMGAPMMERERWSHGGAPLFSHQEPASLVFISNLPSHLPWGLRSSRLVCLWPRLSRGQHEPKEWHHATPISLRNRMIRPMLPPLILYYALDENR